MRIAFASGKGGTGKTTLATNMAAVLARDNDEVLFADTDVEEPNGHIFLKPEVEDIIDVKVPVPVINDSTCTQCGECIEICNYNALALLNGKVAVFDSLCHSCGACIELCPEHAIAEQQRSIGIINRGVSGSTCFYSGCLKIGEALSPALIRTLKSMLPRKGIMIIDAPPGTSCPVVEAVKECDFIVLVTEPTPFGLNDLILAYGLTQELHIPAGVVINRSDMGDKDARSHIEERGMNVLMEIPFQRESAVAYSNGELYCDRNSDYSHKMISLYDSIQKAVSHE